MILAGDIGGTHTRLALFEPPGLRPLHLEVFASDAHDGLAGLVRTYLSGRDLTGPGAGIEGACFGVAGPVQEGRTVAVNLAWSVDAAELSESLCVGPVQVVNDLEANAWGLTALGPDDLATVVAGEADPAGNVVLLSPGTGLGEAIIVRGAAGEQVTASEGGHRDFAPRGETQVALYRFLAAQYGHVSYERVCSGVGLVNIHRFLCQHEYEPAPDWLQQEMDEGDAAGTVSRAGLEHRDDVCSRALDLMIAILAAEAGNLALSVLATGGVYLGGGIPPRILPRLTEGGFARAFAAKGRFHELMANVPVKVILNDEAALLGAARRAMAVRPA